MISQVNGKVVYKSDRYIVVNVGGIGFKIFGTSDLLLSSVEGDEIFVWTYLAVRENALDLYGFKNKDELDFFELLLTVSGIGPKTAINILSVSNVSSLRKAITTGDISHLVKVSGIGKKVADKIVLELKGKAGVSDSSDVSFRDEIDAVEALKALGFTQRDARDALSEIDKKIVNTSQRVREALKILGK